MPDVPSHPIAVHVVIAEPATGTDAALIAESCERPEEFAALRLRPALAHALAELSRGDRDTLLLIAWADLTYEETAAALSIPVGTVRSRLHRARRQLRAALGGIDPTEESTDG